jgi:hypothetical protein
MANDFSVHMSDAWANELTSIPIELMGFSGRMLGSLVGPVTRL